MPSGLPISVWLRRMRPCSQPDGNVLVYSRHRTVGVRTSMLKPRDGIKNLRANSCVVKKSRVGFRSYMCLTDGFTSNMARAVWRSFRALRSQRCTAIPWFSSIVEDSGLRDFPGQGVGDRPQIIHLGGSEDKNIHRDIVILKQPMGLPLYVPLG